MACPAHLLLVTVALAVLSQAAASGAAKKGATNGISIPCRVNGQVCRLVSFTRRTEDGQCICTITAYIQGQYRMMNSRFKPYQMEVQCGNECKNFERTERNATNPKTQTVYKACYCVQPPTE